MQKDTKMGLLTYQQLHPIAFLRTVHVDENLKSTNNEQMITARGCVHFALHFIFTSATLRFANLPNFMEPCTFHRRATNYRDVVF